MFDLSDTLSLQQGDKIMLCSDGLWGTLDDDEIVTELGLHPVGDAVPDLVERALRRRASAATTSP